MIWLLSNLWWLVPVLIGLLALLNPAGLALLNRVPRPVWLALAGIGVLGLAFQAGRWYERDTLEARQADAEDRADLKAAKTAGRAAEKAEAATTDIRKESAHVQTRIREVVRTVPAGCPAMPDELRDLLQRQVEAARAELPAASGGSDP